MSIAISADSHVVEAAEVFTGLAERFGDEAPRIVDVGRHVDAMVIPAAPKIRPRGAAWDGIAGLRLHPQISLERRKTHKPMVRRSGAALPSRHSGFSPARACA